MRFLVVYYSRTGNTELAATTIAQELTADLIRVEPIREWKVPWLYLIGGFAAITDKCSPIKPVAMNTDGYDAIFIGSPIWASRPSPAINSYIAQANLSSRNIIAFFTMGGPDYDKAAANIRRKINNRSGRLVTSFAFNQQRLAKEEIILQANNAISMLNADSNRND